MDARGRDINYCGGGGDSVDYRATARQLAHTSINSSFTYLASELLLSSDKLSTTAYQSVSQSINHAA